MKICIFGADGRTGVEVVKESLSQKHDVVAFVYDKKSKRYLPKEIEIITGDVMDSKDVKKAVSNCDAVISVIGHIKGSDPRMQTKGIKNIINSMKDCGLKRIVSLTGTGVRFKGDKPSLFDRLGNIVIKFIDRNRIIDGIQHADVLKSSDLDWTVLRVLKLSQQSEENIQYHLTDHGPAENLTSRKKAAKILVDLLSSDKYIQKAPVVSKK